MGYDWEKLYEGPRFEKRAKRRKLNRILNTLIGVVVILIIIFGGRLLFGPGNNSTETASPQVANSTDVAEVDDEKEETKDTEQSTDTSEDSSDSTEDEDKEKTEETATNTEQVEPESNEEATVTDGDPESNIIRTIENPAWKPIGTSQVEPQTNVYDKGTENRNEIEVAASYATGLDLANMTVWWLTNNGPDKTKVTIASKDGSQNYKVYMDWISGEGWKPVLVEELKENDSPIFQQNSTSEEESENEDESDEE
ncbi:YrrS family protein [Cytobacillus suaedae]|nr:YrrS family protein [Cytobacillus suaedae]